MAAQGQRSPRLNVMASKRRMQTGSSSLALAIGTHRPLRSSNASRARSAGSTSHRCGTPSSRIHRALAVEVEPAGRGGQHLAHPVRRKGDVRGLGVVRHPLAAPSGEVRNQDVFAKMQLRLVDDPPSAGTADLVMVGIADPSTQHRARQCMGHRGPRVRVEDALDDLGDAMGGRVENVLIGGPRRAGSRLGVASGRGHGAHSDSCAGSCRHCLRMGNAPPPAIATAPAASGPRSASPPRPGVNRATRRPANRPDAGGAPAIGIEARRAETRPRRGSVRSTRARAPKGHRPPEQEPEKPSRGHGPVNRIDFESPRSGHPLCRSRPDPLELRRRLPAG